MKKVFLAIAAVISSLNMFADEKIDTLSTNVLETQVDGKISFSPKNVATITYKFESNGCKYEVACYGIGRTIVQRGLLPTYKDKIKRFSKNGEKSKEYKQIETIRNLQDATTMVLLYK